MINEGDKMIAKNRNEQTAKKAIIGYIIGGMLSMILIIMLPEKYDMYAYSVMTIFIAIFVISNSKKVFNNLPSQISDALKIQNTLQIALSIYILLIMNITITYLTRGKYASNTLFVNHEALYAFLAILIVPITEECIFKFFFLDKTEFLNRNKRIKIMVVAIIFSLGHIMATLMVSVELASLGFIYYVSLYLISALFYYKKGILYAILIHAGANAAALFLTMI